MTWPRVAAQRIREIFTKPQLDAELDEELQSHLEMLADENMQCGMSPEQARRAAKLALGGTEHIKEAVRDQRGLPFLESLIANVRFGARMLRKSPGFTAVAVLTLALGIGANTAIFTVAYATLLAPLPYPHPDRLVNIESKLPQLPGHLGVSPGDFIDWKRQSTSFEDLNACNTDNFNIATQDRPEYFNGIEATPGYYATLGNPLFLGRNFLPEEGEPGKDHVVILTHQLWQHLGSNPKIIGQTMRINGEPHTVVGVFAPGVADRWDWQLFVPLVWKPEVRASHDSRYWLVTGRLKPGVTIQQAQAEMNTITAQEAKDYPKTNQGWSALVEPYENIFLPRDRQRTLWLLLGAVGFLLLIACLNVANLLLAKGIARQKEVAIRGVLGARRTAIFAQFLTESLVLSVLGGLLGVAVGYAMLGGLVAAMPPESLPAEADLRLNVPILLIMLAVTTLAGALFGYAPAWYASRTNPVGVLKEGGRSGTGAGRHRLRRILVIAEFALALPLLTGAGLAIHSFWNLAHADLGVRIDHILGFYVDPASLSPFENNPKQTNSYYRRILTSIEAVPGVSDVCAMTYLPLDSMHDETRFTIAGEPAYANPTLRPTSDLEMVSPGCFQTFGIRIITGRAFTDADNASSVKVAMVNETFARRFLKGTDPLQQRVVMKQVSYEGLENGPDAEWQIVGVFHTVKSRGSREDNPEIDTPFWQEAAPVSAIGVRTAEDPATMTRSIAAAVNAVDPQAALAMTRTMEHLQDEELANDRFTLILFASFAVVGLLLAAVGIHGVTAFSVAQRSHEMALRIALGATRNRVIALVLKEGLVLACVGLALGLIGSYFVGRAMQSILFSVGAIDLSTLVAVGAVLLAAALLGCYIPAWRATKADPMVALRHE